MPGRVIFMWIRALEPKRLVVRPGPHFSAYVADFDAVSAAHTEWFVQHLGTGSAAAAP